MRDVRVRAAIPADGNAALEPFRQVATPIAEAVMPMPYPGIYQFTEGVGSPVVASSVPGSCEALE